MADLSTGTRFGKFESKSMRLSNRDIVLVIGVVVALIITMTTIVYKDDLFTSARHIFVPKKISMTEQLIDFIGKHSNVKHSL